MIDIDQWEEMIKNRALGLARCEALETLEELRATRKALVDLLSAWDIRKSIDPGLVRSRSEALRAARKLVSG